MEYSQTDISNKSDVWRWEQLKEVIAVRFFETTLRMCAYVALVGLGMFCGVVARELHLPPYHAWRTTDAVTGADYRATDVDALISIVDRGDVEALRTELVTLLWGEPMLPATRPFLIEEGFSDTRYADVTALSRIDKLSVVMEFGIESYAYHFTPKTPNNNVVIYHQGHSGDFYIGKEQIAALLEDGYSVVGFSMPLLGMNNQPTVYLPRLGYLKLTTHDHLKFVRPEQGHPIKFFLEPVVSVLNHLEDEFDYSSVAMIGISGGGWTTTLAAAIDTRIEKSFPVAGSYPIYLRSDSQRDWGDYEQTAPELYTTVNYLELYILGSHGLGRKQLQIINQYDPCCFGGTKWETYKGPVRARVQELGAGEFNLFVDDSHRDHSISTVAMDRILLELGDRRR